MQAPQPAHLMEFKFDASKRQGGNGLVEAGFQAIAGAIGATVVAERSSWRRQG